MCGHSCEQKKVHECLMVSHDFFFFLSPAKLLLLPTFQAEPFHSLSFHLPQTSMITVAL